MSHSIHALIIDDDRNSLSVLGESLTLQGATCTQIQDPALLKAALSKLTQVDVVFVDLEMPTLDGFAVLKMLQSDARFQNVPMVAYTVHVSEINKARKLGFHSFLAKPLDLDRFPDQFSRIMRGEHVWSNV